MGIIFFLFLIPVIIIVIISFIRIFVYILSKQIGTKEIVLGLITSLIIFGIICLSYIIQRTAWGLSPAFMLPIIMIVLPFIVHTFTEKSKNQKLAYFSLILLTSIGITTILGITFDSLWFGLLDYLEIKKYY